jgi:hypothetical protein
MIQGMFSKITQQFAQGFGTVQAMAFNKFIYLLEALFSSEGESVGDSHITRK